MASRKNWGPKKVLTPLEREQMRRKRTLAGRKGGERSRELGFRDAKKSVDEKNV